MQPKNVRPLTDAEIEAFTGDSSVNVGVTSTDGKEYYGDGCADYPDGEHAAGFVVDEDGYYIEVARR